MSGEILSKGLPCPQEIGDDRESGTAVPSSTWRGPAHHAQAAGELAQEIMLVELRTGLVLVEQGELELLHLLKVVVEDKLLGECGVEVVDCRFRPVVLAEGQGNGRQSQVLVQPFSSCQKSFC